MNYFCEIEGFVDTHLCTSFVWYSDCAYYWIRIRALIKYIYLGRRFPLDLVIHLIHYIFFSISLDPCTWRLRRPSSSANYSRITSKPLNPRNIGAPVSCVRSDASLNWLWSAKFFLVNVLTAWGTNFDVDHSKGFQTRRAMQRNPNWYWESLV